MAVVDGQNEWAKIAEDPFDSGTSLHANTDGWFKVSWRKDQAINGYILLGTQAVAEYSGWTGAAALTLGVEQSGRRFEQTYLVISQAACPMGIGFYSDGTPFLVEFTLVLAKGSPFEGSAIRVHAFWLDTPVTGVLEAPDFYDLTAIIQNKPSEKPGRFLANANQGGLMNRMIGLLCAVHTAERIGESAGIWWAPNEHCAARLSDIFDIEASGLKLKDPSFIAERYRLFTTYGEADKLLELDPDRHTVVHTITPFRGPDGVMPSHEELGAVFRRFVLSAAVRAKLRRYDDVDFTKVIGLHIRRPYPSGAFAQQEQAKFQLSEDLFLNLLQDLRDNQPGFTSVLLCTNDFSTERSVLGRFPDYVFVNEKESVDNTSDHVAVQEALVDQALLARCPVMFSQSTTMFGMFASAIGGSDMFSLTTESDPDNYLFWHFRAGDHVDSFDCHHRNLRALNERIEGRRRLK